MEIGEARLAFTTDSYVVHPLFFPGGDIGKLAVCGTVNDLAMCGATPRYLSVGMIIEEGFSRTDLEKVTASMQATAENAGVQLVTGDIGRHGLSILAAREGLKFETEILSDCGLLNGAVKRLLDAKIDCIACVISPVADWQPPSRRLQPTRE